jgi:uncharacterized protein YgiM (DUF1202 family)
MNHIVRKMLLTAAVLTVFAAPALAESAACVVTAPEIRLRKGPSKQSQVIAILKKDTLATAVGKCGGGWVKVTAKDGKLSGYVGGWALGEATPKAAAAPAVAATPVVAKTDAPAPAAAPKEVPTNELLAIQITDLRLKVLGLDRDVDMMKKDIHKIKATIGRKVRHKQKMAAK